MAKNLTKTWGTWEEKNIEIGCRNGRSQEEITKAIKEFKANIIIVKPGVLWSDNKGERWANANVVAGIILQENNNWSSKDYVHKKITELNVPIKVGQCNGKHNIFYPLNRTRKKLLELAKKNKS